MIQKPECAININKLLNTLKSFDFILLQEVANQMILLKRLNKKYNIIEHISGRETMTTLIDKKYNISQTLFGQFMSGRPFQVILLTNNICLINVHLPHIQNLNQELIKIQNYLINKNIDLSKYRIIIGGDFNINIPKNIMFMNKILTTSKSLNSCCTNDLNTNKLKYNFDHILDSDNKIVKTKIVFPHKNNIMLPASDHVGIYCKLFK